MEILVAEHLENPEDGFGLQQVALEEVASGLRGSVALMWSSSRYVGATRSETRLPGFAEAVGAALGLGFPVLVRNSGGGAVAASCGSISFSLTFPITDRRGRNVGFGARTLGDAQPKYLNSPEPEIFFNTGSVPPQAAVVRSTSSKALPVFRPRIRDTQ